MSRQSVTCLAFLLALAAGCDWPGTDPGDRPDWEPLGLEGKLILALAWTEWGLFAATPFHGVFRLDEARDEWLPVGLDHAMASALVYVPGDTARVLVGMSAYGTETTDAAVYASADGGASWVPWDGGLAAERDGRYWVLSLAQDQNAPGRLIWAGYGDILLSEDGGASWELVREGAGFGPDLFAAAISADEPQTMWTGGVTPFFQSVVYRSLDGGQSWEESEPIPRSENAVNELAAVPGVPGRVVAGMMGGIMRSDDAGATWTIVLRNAGAVYGLAWTDGCLYATATDGEDFDSLRLFRSCDGGDAWRELRVPDTLSGGSVIIADPENRLIVGTAISGVWRVRF